MHLKLKSIIRFFVFFLLNLFAQDCFSQSLEFKREISGYEQKPERINFVDPISIAVNDVTGMVYVADITSASVQKFNSSGKFISKIGYDNRYGSVSSIATDISGNLYVVDEFHSEIKKFDAEDVLLATFPYEKPSVYSFIKDIAVAPSGNIYMIESECGCIKKYGADGSFEMNWGTSGTADGQFNQPGRITIDADGTIYVLDILRIQKFKEDGTFISSIGLSIIDEFNQQIYDVSVDAAGNIYTIYNGYTDYDNLVYSNVVRVYRPNGTILNTWNRTEHSDQIGAASSLVISKAGILYELWNRKMHSYETNGTFINQWGSQALDGQFYLPSDVAIDSKQNIYVGDKGHNRIQKFDKNGKFIKSWYHTNASKIAIDKDDNVFVVDQDYNFDVRKYDSDGAFLLKWGIEGTGNSQFKLPSDIAIDGEGNVYVVDAGNYRVQKFTNGGEFISILATTRPINEGIQSARFITIDKSGNIYIVHRGSNTIQKYTSNWEFVLQWGEIGENDGQFAPSSIADIGVDTTGNIYVTDRYSVQLFSNTGIFISKWSEIGCGYNQAREPLGIAVDDSGTVYLVDGSNNRVLASNVIAEEPDEELPTSVHAASSMDLQIHVFPNPSEGALTVTSEYPIEAITLINSMGQTQIVGDKSHITTTFKGLVLVEVQTDHGREVKKIIIQ